MSAWQRLRELPVALDRDYGVRLWHLDLHPLPGDEQRALLSEGDRARMAALPGPDAGRLMARRALLALVAAEELGCGYEDLQWRPGGTPTVRGPDGRSVHVSLSVSGDRGLLATARQPVGVDLEEHTDVPEALEIARLMLADGECAWVQAGADVAPEELLTRFLRTWVRKEAVVKCTGSGLAGCDLQAFSVDASRPVALVRDGAGRPTGLVTVEVALDGAHAAVAVAAA